MNTLHDSQNRIFTPRRLAIAASTGSAVLALLGCGNGNSDSIDKYDPNHPTTIVTLPSTTKIENLTQFVTERCESELDAQETRDAVFLIEQTNGTSTALVQPGAEFKIPVALCSLVQNENN